MPESFENTAPSEVKALLNFIAETQDGKFTTHKPGLATVAFRRLEIQEQEQELEDVAESESNEEPVLFGISP